MHQKFKYRAAFSSEISASSSDGNLNLDLSQASLDSLKTLLPNDVDLETNIDLLGVAFNAAVVNVFNKNHDGINTDVAKAVYKYFIHKPTNIEHKKEKIVGHVINSAFSSFGDNQIISEDEIDESLNPFNIALSAVVYKTTNKDFASLLEQSIDPDSGMFNTISASWEIGFNDYMIAVGSKNLKEAEIVSNEKQIDELKHYLKAFDGEGLMDDGTENYRLVAGDVYPLGIGFTTNPAANVKGVIELDNKKKDEEAEAQEQEFNEKIEINTEEFLKKIEKNKKNFSHNEKDTVISNKDKFNPETNIMEMKDIINELKETIQASNSEKFSDEAVANVVKVVSDAIREKSDTFAQEKAEIEKQNAEVAKAKDEALEKVKALEEQLASTQESLTKIEAEQKAAAASQLFNDRMDSLDKSYDLTDEDRQILASDLKGLDEAEESFAKYQERMAIIYKHKSKEFLAEQEKAFAEKVEAAVAEKLKGSEKTETAEASSEEDVEEVLENVEASESVSSNNGESTEKESITIKY